ncbi:MAG: MATE family efflux transporter [Chloroflexota bacterium]
MQIDEKPKNPENHAFIDNPNRTLIVLSIPVLFSLIAEPITGLIDTAFIAQLGSVPLAALGVGTVALSSTFWIFNFLGIGAQTEVAQALGNQNREGAVKASSLALALSILFGLGMFIIGAPLATVIARLLGAEGAVLTDATAYIQVRLFAAPAVLITFTGFGVLRGMQDMQTPLWIAITINVINIVLDAPFIYGFGMIPALGVAGSALATVIAQWVGVAMTLWMIGRHLGYTRDIHFADAVKLMKIGGDLFIRTGSLTFFILLATSVATRIGVDSGASHQAIRQVWFFSTLTMEAFAVTAQSLVGYFVGATAIRYARRVSAYCTVWSIGTGVVLAILMLLSTDLVIAAFVPESAVAVFMPAWIVASVSQPLSAVAFVTDGIHWGTGDYRYMRNGMIIATLIASISLFLIDTTANNALVYVWLGTVLWIALRSIWGIVRVFPGVGDAPIGAEKVQASPA